MLKSLFAALALWTAAAVPSAAADSFRIGVAPHTSARVIIAQYQPVRAALEAALGDPVEVITAPDFTEFARRAVAGEYDLAITTAHQAELLRADAGYLPLLTYTADLRSVVVVPAASPACGTKALEGAVVLGLDPSSLVTLWGQHWLGNVRATPRQIRYVSAADSVAQLLLAGEAQAGFMSLANFHKLAPDVQAQLRLDVQSDPIPGRVYMLNDRQAARQETIGAALLRFGASPEGKRYFDENKLDGYRPISVAELKGMAPFADEVRRILKAGGQ